MSLTVTPVHGLPEITEGADLAALVAANAPEVRDGDIVVVSSKIVSKAEGRVVAGDSRDAAIDAETVRVVARRGDTRIVETRHGFVMAAAGVDNSNVEPGRLVLLPLDPDASARRLRAALAARLGRRLGVIVTDTFGRPWRLGQTDLAVGAAGVRVLDDHGGSTDRYGNPLAVTAPAHADELASAAELVMGKLAGVPVAVVSGLADAVTTEDGPGVRALVRGSETDMFRLGTRDAFQEAARLPRGADAIGDGPVDPSLVRTALSAAQLPAGLELVEVGEDPLLGKLLATAGLSGPAAYAVVPFLAADAPGSAGGAADPSALLEAGAAIDALLLSCAAYGLATHWTRPRDLDGPAVGALLSVEPREPLGVLRIGAHP